MKKSFIPFLSLGFLLFGTSCTLKEDAQSDSLSIRKGTELTVTATIFNESGSKTILLPDLSINWTQGDDINLFYSDKTSGHFITQLESPAVTAEFSGYLWDDIETIGQVGLSRPYWGVYPYDKSNTCDGEGVILTIPSSQNSVEGSFANKLNPAVANSSSSSLHFYNVCAPFYFSVTQEGVNSLVFRGNNNEDIAGKVKVTMGADGKPISSIIDGQKSIKIVAPGATEGGTFEPGKTYILVLIPQTLSGGYTVTLYKGTAVAECVVSKSTDFQRAVGRSKLRVDEGLAYFFSGLAAPANLAVNGTANCYLVSSEGTYCFPAVKGNSSESVGDVASAEVLWESFGTGETPSVGDIVPSVSCVDGSNCEVDTICFSTPPTLKNGNAVIAAKDATGEILWSWHIWVCKDFDPVATGQEYYNNAGTMMDRNLGATSATPGDVGALGLLYQWGRKDPFLSSRSILFRNQAASTLSWPSAIKSDASTGTIEYATGHPTTFLGFEPNNVPDDSRNYDWYYTGTNSTDDTRWQSFKTIFDPCPPGWRVPDGGLGGVWSKAIDDSNAFSYSYDETNKGMNFTRKFGSAISIWYPAAGYLGGNDGGSLNEVGSGGYWWSCTPYEHNAYIFAFSISDNGYPSMRGKREYGYSIRCQKEGTGGGAAPPVIDFNTATDLSSEGTANCYVVSAVGTYKFPSVQGNSATSVGSVSSVEVLWESFGKNVKPSVGDIIASTALSDGYVVFNTPAALNNGNAVIAAKDANGEILWSWHIWVCKDYDPDDTAQEYDNNAGTMMDRNLGATSATPGDVGALGLMYQWGRKDPFLGSSSISNIRQSISTITWPSTVASDATNGTIEYAVMQPTTFITSNSSNYDWYYTGGNSTDNTRWQTTKTIYDPCPPGWRVPDGGDGGVWSKAVGGGSSFSYTWDHTNKGLNFSGKFDSASAIWYPAAGFLSSAEGRFTMVVGSGGYWWSCTPDVSRAYDLIIDNGGTVSPSGGGYRASGLSVRCQKEETPSIDFNTATNLSSDGTANCYVVPAAGTYKFSSVKGNSSTSVGSVSSVEVLWESFGTNKTPSVGDIIADVAFADGFVGFKTPATLKNGNAVIAAKNSSGTILWSWHIWVCKDFDPVATEQVYYNNAGTMMDRNLGATSATPGNVGALGLLYQWGRKDPFLSGNSISSSTKAASTLSWPSTVSSNSSNGTIAYAIAHPTTFITYNSNNYDWYYTGSINDTRWQSTKTIYDPCPPGWKVPFGGNSGVWSKAVDSSSSFSYTWNSSSYGMNFSGKFGSASTIWYPAAGYLRYDDGSLSAVGSNSYWWSYTPNGNSAHRLYLDHTGDVLPSGGNRRARGHSVRCQKE